jgi:hypothetical protein
MKSCDFDDWSDVFASLKSSNHKNHSLDFWALVPITRHPIKDQGSRRPRLLPTRTLMIFLDILDGRFAELFQDV